MKRLIGIWSALFALIGTVSAQVSVELVIDQQYVLPGEKLTVAVKITNFSGRTLKFGQDNDWLKFSLSARDGFVVPKLSDVPVTGEFEVQTSHVATRRVDLAPYYAFDKPGRYQVVATVKLAEWNEEKVSPAAGFGVISGVKLWSQAIGLPPAPEVKDAPPEIRKYILLQVTQLDRMHLYFKLTDQNENIMFRVFPLATMVSFGKPQAQIDYQGNLHVLHQISARSFNYHTLNYNGEVTARQTYDYTGSPPKLVISDDGKVTVSRAVRRAAHTDIPAKESDAKPETP